MINVTIAIESEAAQVSAPHVRVEVQKSDLKLVEGAGGCSQLKLITLKELAERLKLDRSAARRYVMRLGFEPKRARTAASGFQSALVFTPDQVSQIVKARTADGYC
jgi:hypothetical protein